jgi:hypothetical protein
MKVSEIQTAIFEQTGIKTSVKKMTGSMKRHIKVWPIYQGGKYPDFPHEWLQEFKKQFKGVPETDTWPYCTVSDLNLPAALFEFDPIQYPKESKLKPIDENKVMKGWGSKNSQLRLDKATARNAKKLRAGTTARYY